MVLLDSGAAVSAEMSCLTPHFMYTIQSFVLPPLLICSASELGPLSHVLIYI